MDFTRIETECSYDFVFVYDGDSYNSTKLASVSGDTLPKSFLAKSGHVCGVCFLFFLVITYLSLIRKIFCILTKQYLITALPVVTL